MTTLDDLAGLVAELKGLQIRNITMEKIKEKLAILLEGQPVIRVTYDCENTFVRSRVCPANKNFSTLLDLIYPPTATQSYGRASVPNSQVLYASFNKGTSMDEIEVETKNIVQTIVFRPIQSHKISLVAVGEIQAAAANGRTRVCGPKLVNRVEEWITSDRAQFNKYLFVDAFLAEVFSTKTAKSSDYAISACFADIIYEKYDMGVLFPSVRRDNGWNLALPRGLFDKSCEVLMVMEEKINGVYGYGIYDPDCKNLRSTNKFDPDGRIAWERTQPTFHTSWTLSSGGSFPSDQVGWRPNRA